MYRSIPLQMNMNDFLFLIGLVLIFALFFTMIDASRRKRKFRIELPRIKTELICVSCGLKEIRDFKEDDYISKMTGEKCKKCGDELRISAIYTPPPKEVT